ncbi:uncharacterized protein LOC141716943 [Apium graveolens]|uniref:uncharacterized protein LOC141716943 n=1 Tax=Apium graveolens TaxID=4045 RepID=UPI003D79AAFC
MSRFINLVETFDFTTLSFETYGEKIDDLLKRFPKFEKDDNYRTVLPSKFLKTADDYVSIKFCTLGRYPVYGIYNSRDLDLVGVCVHGDVMYALDDFDLHPSFVPDLKVHKLCLGIQYSPLATRETVSYTKNCMCSAISTLSLGFTPQKKNEWCEAIVLVSGLTTQAVRFSEMKYFAQKGIGFGYKGRYTLPVREIAVQNRWNKLSRAMRDGEYPYVFSHYSDIGTYNAGCVTELGARDTVSLINDKGKTRRQKFRRRLDRWNGPLENGIRKREEECKKRMILEKQERIAKINSSVVGSMHGFWYGSVRNLKYEAASLSSTHPLDRLRVGLQVQTNLSSTRLVVKSIWNGGLLAFSRGTSMMVENRAFWLRRSSPNPSLRASVQRAVVDCTGLVFTAAASSLCAKRHKNDCSA